MDTGRVGGRRSVDSDLEGDGEDIPLASVFGGGVKGGDSEMRANAEDRRECVRMYSSRVGGMEGWQLGSLKWTK